MSQNQNILLGSDAAEWLGTGRPLGVPTQSWAFIILTLVAWFVLQRTRFGRLLLLSGANRVAGTASGLRIGQAALLGLTLLGFCCGITGIFAAAQAFGLKSSRVLSIVCIITATAALLKPTLSRSFRSHVRRSAVG